MITAGANYQNYLIGVQSVVIDALDRLWILDTGRALTPSGVLVQSSYGGPKLIGVNLTDNSIFQTILFPQTVAYPDTYLNDVRFDLRPNSTASGQGLAYITDSSLEGRNGIIIVDLGTGESWRHLDGTEYVRPEQQFLAFVHGQPLYFIPRAGMPITYLGFGSDGIAISADFDTLFFCPLASRYLYSIPTSALNSRTQTSELLAQAAVVNRGQKGVTDGMETDTNNFIYMGNLELNAINIYNPANATVQVFVRDPRIDWVDTSELSSLYMAAAVQ